MDPIHFFAGKVADSGVIMAESPDSPSLAIMIEPDRLVRLLDDHATALELYAAQWADSPADVVQEAFIRLAGQSPVPDRVLPWLYRVVRNTAISAARSAGRRRKHEQNAAELNRSWFEENGHNPLDAELATRALRKLETFSREVVIARIWGGLSFEEIGETCGVSSSTAHRRYESAMRQLRKELGESCPMNFESLTN